MIASASSAYSPGGGLETHRTAARRLELSAELPQIPAADRALADIRTGKANGPIGRIPGRSRSPASTACA